MELLVTHWHKVQIKNNWKRFRRWPLRGPYLIFKINANARINKVEMIKIDNMITEDYAVKIRAYAPVKIFFSVGIS